MRTLEFILDDYDASVPGEYGRVCATEIGRVLTALYFGRRMYVTSVYLEGDAREGVFVTICEPTPCDCGKCARGECDPNQEWHNDGGYIRSRHQAVSA